MKLISTGLVAGLLAFVMVSSTLPLSLGDDTPIFSSPGTIRPYWSVTWGGEGDEIINDIGVAEDGVYVCGVIISSNAKKAFLLKYNDNGKLQWNTTWSGNGNAEAEALQIYEGNVYIAGTTEANGNEDVFIACYDGEGNSQWFTTWGGSSDDEGKGIAVYDDKIFVGGSTRSFGSLGSDVVLIKLNMDGDIAWHKIWGGSKDDGGNDVAVTPDGIFIAGYTSSYGSGGKDVLVLGFNDKGEFQWMKTWGGESDDEMMGIIYSRPYLYTAGVTSSYTPHALSIKYDSTGNMLFERRWGEEGEDEATDAAIYEDTFYLTGITKSYGKGGDVFLLKYDSDGMLSWSKIWGGKEEDKANAIAIYDKRIYMAGYTSSYGNGGKDALIIKCGLEGRRSFSLTSGELLIFRNNALYLGGREIIPLIPASSGETGFASYS